MFDSPGVLRVPQFLILLVALGLPVLAAFLRPARGGIALLGGWLAAVTVHFVYDAVSLLWPQTVSGTEYTGRIGLGLVVRFLVLGGAAAVAAIGWTQLRGRDSDEGFVPTGFPVRSPLPA